MAEIHYIGNNYNVRFWLRFQMAISDLLIIHPNLTLNLLYSKKMSQNMLMNINFKKILIENFIETSVKDLGLQILILL